MEEDQKKGTTMLGRTMRLLGRTLAPTRISDSSRLYDRDEAYSRMLAHREEYKQRVLEIRRQRVSEQDQDGFLHELKHVMLMEGSMFIQDPPERDSDEERAQEVSQASPRRITSANPFDRSGVRHQGSYGGVERRGRGETGTHVGFPVPSICPHDCSTVEEECTMALSAAN